MIADIGSGTGIFTAQLLNCGYQVYAVEPNADMCRKAEEKLSGWEGFSSVDGADKATNLPDHSVDCVTAAQAFHWFDAEAFRAECRRILKPGGRVMIVYNARDEKAACTQGLAALRRKYNPEFHGFSNGISDEACRAFFDGECAVFRADNSQSYDRQGYIDRVLSSSYSLKETDAQYGAYLEEIGVLFETYAVDGVLTVPVYTTAYIGKP